MAFTDAQVSDVVERLSRDLRSTGMASYLYLVGREVAHARELFDHPNFFMAKDDPRRFEWFEEKIVEDVQQDILDSIIVWPPCPHHPNHPLWYHDGNWVCEQEQVSIATVGALPGQRVRE